MDNRKDGRDPSGQALVASDGAASVSTLAGFDPSREVDALRTAYIALASQPPEAHLRMLSYLNERLADERTKGMKIATAFGRFARKAGKAIATEARRAATGNTDAVEDEGAGPQDIAPKADAQ